jgi:hypothetical protein
MVKGEGRCNTFGRDQEAFACYILIYLDTICR